MTRMNFDKCNMMMVANLARDEESCGTAKLKLSLGDSLHTGEVYVHKLHPGVQRLVVEFKALLHLYHPVYKYCSHTH